MPPLSRRRFLARSAALSATTLGLAAGRGLPQERGRFPGLIVRNSEPRNLEYPFAALQEPVIPNEQFFVRSHFAVPSITPDLWSLSVGGNVLQKGTFRLNDLLKLPAKTLTSTMECAGNGRVFLKPSVPGLQWGLGGIGTAKWKGVSLATLLDRVGVPKAVEVLVEGADKGPVNSDPRSPGPIHFDRSIPWTQAVKPETILAYEMNGRPIPEEHGGPVRLVVPGWYGMASIKWVQRIVVLEEPYQGFWQTLDYSYFVRKHGSPSLVPLTTMQVKSSIIDPAPGSMVGQGQKVTVRGAAWTGGEATIKTVEFSADGGKSWQPARLTAPSEPYLWSFWEADWQLPAQAGNASLLSRATDSNGQSQPLERDPDRRSYMINHLIPTSVAVR